MELVQLVGRWKESMQPLEELVLELGICWDFMDSLGPTFAEDLECLRGSFWCESVVPNDHHLGLHILQPIWGSSIAIISGG